MTSHAVSDEALDIIFRHARTQNKWQDKPVSNALLMAIYDLMRWGPTAANVSPARIVFRDLARKPRSGSSRISSPATGQDHGRARRRHHRHGSGFSGSISPALSQQSQDEGRLCRQGGIHAGHSRLRNASLQGGYFIIAARALGLDCGPMSGFDNAGVDKEFFAGTNIKSNFICALGYGDPAGVFPRNPRLSFDEACKIL